MSVQSAVTFTASTAMDSVNQGQKISPPPNSRKFQKATIHKAPTLYFNYFHSIYTLLGNRCNLKMI